MRNPRTLGWTLLGASLLLLTVLAYEPANVVTALGLQNEASEASIVVAGLLLVSAGTVTGAVHLRCARLAAAGKN